MRSTSNFAMCTGFVFLAGAVAAPHILAWQAANLLREYGAERYLGTVIEAHIAPLQPGYIAVTVLAALAVGTGAWIRRLHRHALYVLVVILGLLLGLTAWGTLVGPDTARAFAVLGTVWLVIALKYTWTTCRKAAPNTA